MAERKSISKSVRFEVFKRDKFTCQYCGRSAPEVVLHVDHIQPVSKDGENDITNLITACAECNLGKGARELSDDAVIQKRKAQLDELQERREQIEMMSEWQSELMSLEDEIVSNAATLWFNLVDPYCLNEKGLKVLKRLINQYGFNEVVESMKLSADHYLEFESDGKTYDESSVEKTWEYVERIARSRKRVSLRPNLGLAYKLIGRLKYKIDIHNPGEQARRIANCLDRGVYFEVIEELVNHAYSWRYWDDDMRELENGLDSDRR